MNPVFLVVLAYILKTATFVSSKPQLQFTLPARARIARGTDFILEDLPLDEEPLQYKSVNTAHLQEALSALLALNDGELKSLLMGVPVKTVAENLSTQATFLLRASHDRLQKLKSLLSSDEASQQGGFRIAKRRKSAFQNAKNPEIGVNKSEKEKAKSDSLLSAINDLTQYLGEQNELDEHNELDEQNVDEKEPPLRSIRSHVQEKRRYRSSGISHNTHFSYWLRNSECPPSPDQTPRLFCPSPRHSAPKDFEWVCIEESDLCDGHSHCPNHEDEDPHTCMFYKGLKTQLDILVGGLLRHTTRRS